MFLKVKSISITIAMIYSLCLLGLGNHSDALGIEALYASSTEYDWGSGGCHVGYIEVDEGDCYVE